MVTRIKSSNAGIIYESNRGDAVDTDIVKLRETLMGLKRRSQAVRVYDELNTRKRKELEFHNQHRDHERKNQLAQDAFEMLYENKKYYETIGLSREFVYDWIKKHVPNRVFLDYACGDGDFAILAANQGAALSIGIDISDVSVDNAENNAKKAKVDDRCIFLHTDCEATGLPDESIDVILCHGVLHHLDLSYAFPELRRILKKGGVILAVEALDYNPVIKLYRNLTPAMRTDWEKDHILSMKDVRFAGRFFEVAKVRYWHLFSILTAMWRRNGKLKRILLAIFNKLDVFFLKIPLIRLMAWQFTFELQRKNND